MLNEIVFISLVLICFFLYLYVKKEGFEPTVSAEANVVITAILSSEIARVLSISVRRIANVIYNGDLTSGALQVSFTILEPNYGELTNNEKDANIVGILANSLLLSNTFIVNINGISTKISKIIVSPTPVIKQYMNTNLYNNKGLLDIVQYANNKYDSSPNDASLTKFYKLGIDNNFNITPTLT